MSIDLVVRDAVAEWDSPTAEPDWDDVLRRARPRQRPWARGRPALVAVFAAFALLLALPGLGIGERLTSLLGGEKRPGLALGATLVRADGTRAGSFVLSSSRLFVATANGRRPRLLSPTGGRRPRGFPIRWTLSLSGPATSARLVTREDGKTLVLLCRPCAQGVTRGRNLLRRGRFSALFGRADVVVTDAHGEARGHVRLQRPRR